MVPKLIEADRKQQLLNCANWSAAECHRALKDAQREKNPDEKAYLLRRADRLDEQASDLFAQSARTIPFW